jgi:4-amino-4-deoxychorismate lyase
VSQQSASWLDGIPATVLPLPDRGLDFGDGLFETLLVRSGDPLFLNVHLDRLEEGLKTLYFPDCRAAAQQQIQNASRALDSEWRWAALRLSVLRAPGKRGYAPAENLEPRILITVTRIDRDCTNLSPAATMGVADIRLSIQPALARIKHLNRLEQVLAAAQAQAENVDECFVLDQTGHLVSAIAGNIFLVCEGELLTPVLADCGVAGTRRRLIMERWAPAIGLKVREARLTLADLDSAEEVFYSNSLQVVRSISSLGTKAWTNYRVCEALFQQYLGDLA